MCMHCLTAMHFSSQVGWAMFVGLAILLILVPISGKLCTACSTYNCLALN